MKTIILFLTICACGQQLAFAQDPHLYLAPSCGELPTTVEKARTAATAELTSTSASLPAAPEWTYQYADQTRDPETALAAAQKLVALRPDYGPAYHTLGKLYLEMGQLDAAEASFRHYLEIAPTDPQAYEELAHYYLASQQYGQAADAFHEADRLRNKPRHNPRRL